jgi:hypothetical protein
MRFFKNFMQKTLYLAKLAHFSLKFGILKQLNGLFHEIFENFRQ